MAKKLTIKSDDTLNQVLSKLTPSWVDCFPKATIEKGQVAKSSSRNFMFGNIMNAKFIKLLVVDSTGRVDHHIAAAVIFRKCDEITDVFGTTEKRTQPVEPKGDTTMWRCAILKCVE